jgi:hypothetical protein
VVADTSVVPPTVSEEVTRLTLTDATGMGVIVRTRLAVTPPADALIVDEPGACAVRRPPAVIDAAAGSLLVQFTARSVRT